MKIKSIAAICKKKKYVMLIKREDRFGNILQYVSDGGAIYSVEGLPELDKDSLLTIFDIPEKQRDKWIVTTLSDIPGKIELDDTVANEKPVEREEISIVYSDRALKPIQTGQGIVFIESRYLSPTSDVLDVLQLYVRYTEGGVPYIAVKAGFLLQAVIMPFDVINPQFVKNIRELAEQCEISLKYREQEYRHTTLPFGVDPNTGEVISQYDTMKSEEE